MTYDEWKARAYGETDEPEPDYIEPDGPATEKIDGIPFETVKGDLAKCGLCGTVVDVGGEIKAHIAEHKYGELGD